MYDKGLPTLELTTPIMKLYSITTDITGVGNLKRKAPRPPPTLTDKNSNKKQKIKKQTNNTNKKTKEKKRGDTDQV